MKKLKAALKILPMEFLRVLKPMKMWNLPVTRYYADIVLYNQREKYIGHKFVVVASLIIPS